MYYNQLNNEYSETIRVQNIYLHLTRSCNLNCTYCYFSAGKVMPDEMTIPEIMSLWQDIVTLRPRKVIFTGGEPLLLENNIFYLLSGLRDEDDEHNILRCLNTNGALVSDIIAQRFVGLLDEVRISVDAMEVRNDIIRGKGSFRAAINALEKFYTVGFEPIALVTITKFALPDLEELICFLIKKNITRIHFNEFRNYGRGKDINKWKVERAKVHSEILQTFKKVLPDWPLPHFNELSKTYNCILGTHLNIMPNGDVFPCHVLTNKHYHCGNIRAKSLLDICKKNGVFSQLSGSNHMCPQ